MLGALLLGGSVAKDEFFVVAWAASCGEVEIVAQSWKQRLEVDASKN